MRSQCFFGWRNCHACGNGVRRLIPQLSSRIAFYPARRAVSTASIAAGSLPLEWQRSLLPGRR